MAESYGLSPLILREHPRLTTATALLSVRELSFVRDFEPLFEALHFEVHRRQAWLLSGPNGSGKTTLLKVLAGLWRADSGEIWINNEQARDSAWPREWIAYLGHGAQLKADLTPHENLRWISAVHGHAASSNAILRALDDLDVGHLDAQPVRYLSQGQRRRVALGVLKLVPRPLWLLDEPYANLDRAGIALMDELISAQLQADGAVVFSSHGDLKPNLPDLKELKLGARACA